MTKPAMDGSWRPDAGDRPPTAGTSTDLLPVRSALGAHVREAEPEVSKGRAPSTTVRCEKD